MDMSQWMLVPLALAVVIGTLSTLIGGAWMLVEAFSESVLWGIGMMLFGPLAILFIVMHFDRAMKPLALQVVGGLLLLGAASMTGMLQGG